MSEHKASITWAFSGGDFLKGKYSREHTLKTEITVKLPDEQRP